MSLRFWSWMGTGKGRRLFERGGWEEGGGGGGCGRRLGKDGIWFVRRERERERERETFDKTVLSLYR